jgi:hypothetical protein
MLLDGPEDSALIDADQAVAYLIPAAEGVYTLGLAVCDTWGRCEAATTRALVGAKARQSASFGRGVSFGGGLGGLGKNKAPQAEASATRALSGLSVIRLDGSASTDPDGDALRYRWTFSTRPTGSTLTDADIQDSTTALASFKADVSGTYGVRLVVRDGFASDSVTLPGIVVKLLEDHDPVDDDRAATQPGALERAR